METEDEIIDEAIEKHRKSLISRGFVPGRKYWGTLYLKEMMRFTCEIQSIRQPLERKRA